MRRLDQKNGRETSSRGEKKPMRKSFQIQETLKLHKRLLQIEDFFTSLATHLNTMHALRLAVLHNNIFNLAGFIFKYMPYLR